MLEYQKEEWKSKVIEQDKMLRYPSFGRSDALILGLKIAEIAERKYKSGVVSRIYYDGTLVFFYSMDGCGLKNEWWMGAKLNTSLLHRKSSMQALLDLSQDDRTNNIELAETSSYLYCGGCIPLKLTDGTIVGYVVVSALKHEEDHQIIIDAISEILGVDVPSLI